MGRRTGAVSLCSAGIGTGARGLRRDASPGARGGGRSTKRDGTRGRGRSLFGSCFPISLLTRASRDVCCDRDVRIVRGWKKTSMWEFSGKA